MYGSAHSTRGLFRIVAHVLRGWAGQEGQYEQRLGHVDRLDEVQECFRLCYGPCSCGWCQWSANGKLFLYVPS